MVEALLDSVILIDHLNGVPQSATWLAGREWQHLAISPITRAEVLSGARDGESVHIARLLDSFECLQISADVADRAAEIRRRHGIRLPDALQAAIAQTHNLELITRDIHDLASKFEFVSIPYSV